MGMRGELFTTKVSLENRNYFFNVKENRAGDVFLQIVESKIKNGEDVERRDIVLFADNTRDFCRGLDEALSFVERDRRDRSRAARVARAAKDKENAALAERKARIAAAGGEKLERTGRIHVVSKKSDAKPSGDR
jgi:hypothetical protein